MSKLASLLVKITANGAQAERELKELSKKAEDFGKKMKDVGSTMTKYVTGPLLALAAVSVKAANDQQQAEAKLLTALKGREDVQKRLIAQAREMQNRTLFSDEDIISQQAFLAALGLSEQQINDTMEAAIQLSAALGMELDAAVKNLAKTYGGLAGELGESIPALKELTAEQMKAGEAIKYVNENYKGFAETAAETGVGKLGLLKNKFMDLAAKLGAVILPVLERLAEILIPVLETFAEMSPTIQIIIVAIGALVAAIGPLLIVVGSLISALNTIQVAAAASGRSIAVAFGKGGAAFLAVVALVEWVNELTSMTDKLAEEAQNRRRDEITNTREGMKEWALRNYYGGEQPGGWLHGGYVPAKYIEGDHDLDKLKTYLEKLKKNRHQGDPMLKTAEIEGLEAAIREIERSLSLEEVIQEDVGLISQLEAKLSSLREQLKFADTVEEIARINAELEKTNEELTRLQNIKPEDINRQRVSMLPIVGGAPSFGVSGPQASDLLMGVNNINMEIFRANALQKAEQIKGVIAEMNSIVSGAMSELAVTIGEGIGSMLAGEDFDWANRLLGAIGDMLKQLGAALIAYATALEAFKKAFKNPWVALAAGIAAVAAGTAVKAIANKPIKLATGGLAYGPTLAVVGDNPGATNDPEVIAPLSKLRNFMGGQKLELVGDVAFELHGDTMRALLDRNNLRLATLG